MGAFSFDVQTNFIWNNLFAHDYIPPCVMGKHKIKSQIDKNKCNPHVTISKNCFRTLSSMLFYVAEEIGQPTRQPGMPTSHCGGKSRDDEQQIDSGGGEDRKSVV